MKESPDMLPGASELEVVEVVDLDIVLAGVSWRASMPVLVLLMLDFLLGMLDLRWASSGVSRVTTFMPTVEPVEAGMKRDVACLRLMIVRWG